MSGFLIKYRVTLCLALFTNQGVALADNSLGHRDNISANLNQRQKAEMDVLPGFVAGSTLNGFVRNYYFARDNHDTPSRRDQREWAHGLMLSFRSGFTDTPVGVGLDVHGFYGLRLDGGGGSGGGGVLPLDSQGRPADHFSAAGAALKLRGFDSLMQIGDQLLENPVVASGVSRMIPQSYRGVTIKNYHFQSISFDAGFVESTRLRNQSGYSHLATGYGTGTKSGVAADRESPHIAWFGANYIGLDGGAVTLYSGRLEDIWNQSYFGLSQIFRPVDGLALTPWLHYYKTRDQGRSQLGHIDNNLYSAGLTLASGGQSLTFSLQKVDGDTPFDFIAQNDKVFLYESNAMQYADFNGPGEHSWKIQYQTDLAFLAVPNLQVGAAYGRGEANLTRVDPNSEGYGYLYNLDGKHAHHWERDLSIRYAFPVGLFKGLSVTLRWATHRPGEGYTAPGNTRGNSSSDEYRMVVDYPIKLL